MGETPIGTPIRAIEVVRRIRDAFYERTKDMSSAELIAFMAREAQAESTREECAEAPRPAPRRLIQGAALTLTKALGAVWLNARAMRRR